VWWLSQGSIAAFFAMFHESASLMSNAEENNKSRGRASRAEPQAEITTEELLRGQTEVLIHHGDDIYRLRVTKSGKLVLNK
jgi:hemin uptake protein HemP